MNSKNSFAIIACLLVIAIPGLSCTKPKGAFAFKDELENRYKTVQGSPEFEHGKTVDWVYQFDKSYGIRKIGVVVVRKELVWVDIRRRLVPIDKSTWTIYGKISNYQPGTYKIMITEKSDLLDELEFTIYPADDDTDDFDKD